MATPNEFTGIITVILWIAGSLLGLGIGIWAGRFIGTFLGWMIANSLDMNIGQGGRFGRQMGSFFGAAGGIGLGIYGATQFAMFITQHAPH